VAIAACISVDRAGNGAFGVRYVQAFKKADEPAFDLASGQ